MSTRILGLLAFFFLLTGYAVVTAQGPDDEPRSTKHQLAKIFSAENMKALKYIGSRLMDKQVRSDISSFIQDPNIMMTGAIVLILPFVVLSIINLFSGLAPGLFTQTSYGRQLGGSTNFIEHKTVDEALSHVVDRLQKILDGSMKKAAEAEVDPALNEIH